jgi:hypothetical protein
VFVTLGAHPFQWGPVAGLVSGGTRAPTRRGADNRSAQASSGEKFRDGPALGAAQREP